MVCRLTPGRFSLLPWGGITLIELMVVMGLTSFLLLTDMQRHDNNQKATLRQSLLESASNVPHTVRAWLRNPNVISCSFGIKPREASATMATFSQKKAYTSPRSVADRLLEGAKTDEYSIQYLRVPNQGLTGGSLKLRPGTTNNMLIGPPNSDNSDISSSGMDGTGRVYIRAMWVENFSSYFSGYDVNLDPSATTTTNPPPADNWKRGTANLKAVVWRLTSRPTSSLSLTCGDGCAQSIFDISLDIKVDDSNKIIDGSFGLKCGGVFNVAAEATGGSCPAPHEFFDILQAIDNDTTSKFSIESYDGRCCRFIQ